MKRKVRVRKVKRIDKQGHPLQKTWHLHGYDTVWVPPNCGMVPSGQEEDCVWDPDWTKVLDIWEVLRRTDEVDFTLVMDVDFEKGLRFLLDHSGHRSYIMYHGTTLKVAQKIKHHGFRRSSDGMLGPGVYVSRSVEKAARYPLNPELGEKLAIMKLKVRVGKVKRIDKQGHPFQRTWHLHGYDTAWVPPNCGMVPSGLEEDCIWDPDRIKVLDMWEVQRDTNDNPTCVII